MSKLIKIKNSIYLGKFGKLIKRKSHLRKPSKISLSSAKKRVLGLRKGLDKVKNLTINDPNKLEYATLIDKKVKTFNTPIFKGGKNENGLYYVDIPNNLKKDKWIVHSHPDNTPLSISDILQTNKNQSIFNVTLDGSIYRVTPKKSSEEILEEYKNITKKIKELNISNELKNKTKYLNPNVNDLNISQDTSLAIQHKILKTLNNKGFITYRPNLKPGSKRIIERYKELNDINLKRNIINIEFNKKSKYYIPKSKWYKIPKIKRDEIRRREKKYGNNYNLAVKKDKRLKQLYREIGIK